MDTFPSRVRALAKMLIAYRAQINTPGDNDEVNQVEFEAHIATTLGWKHMHFTMHKGVTYEEELGWYLDFGSQTINITGYGDDPDSNYDEIMNRLLKTDKRRLVLTVPNKDITLHHFGNYSKHKVEPTIQTHETVSTPEFIEPIKNVQQPADTRLPHCFRDNFVDIKKFDIVNETFQRQINPHDVENVCVSDIVDERFRYVSVRHKWKPQWEPQVNYYKVHDTHPSWQILNEYCR